VKTDDVDITEITALEATKVSGVTSPANATPFLLLKAQAAAKSDVDTEAVAIEEAVTGDDADNDGAEKGAVQDALDGTAAPQESGQIVSGQSKLAGPVTTGAKLAVPAADQEGGASSYEIADEAKLTKANAVSSLVEAIKILDTQRAAIKDGITTLVDGETEGEATKAGKVLSAKNVAALETAHKHLTSVIDGAKDKATPASPDSETADKETLVTELTKSELAEAITAGVKTILKDEREAESAELAEKAEKLEQAKALVAADLAEKGNVSGGANTGGTQSNNAGEVTESEVKPTKEADANDVNAVKEDEKGEVTKSEDTPDEFTKQVETQLEALTKGQNALQELVSKIAKRPRPGGPSLDGQGRGIAPAAEGRMSDATKSEGDEIGQLTKQLDEATDPMQKSELGLKLTYARLKKAHETGQL
jgi:hypothetical protein